MADPTTPPAGMREPADAGIERVKALEAALRSLVEMVDDGDAPAVGSVDTGSLVARAYVRLAAALRDAADVCLPERASTPMEAGLHTPIELIVAERRRQISKGWTPAHDDAHTNDELAYAAACYLMPRENNVPFRFWPFESAAWRPSSDDRLRELTKAGAFVVAEMERWQRRDADLIAAGGATEEVTRG